MTSTEMETTSSEENRKNESFRRYDVKFFTKDEEYSIPDKPYNIPGFSASSELNQIVKLILTESSTYEGNHVDIDFDFLVEGSILRLPLQDHLEEMELESGVTSLSFGESVVKIEYFIKDIPPSPFTSLAHDDWVSAVDTWDGFVLSGCYDGTLHVWSTVEGKHLFSLPGHPSPIKGVAWVPSISDVDTKIFLSSSHDETIKVWKWSVSKVKSENKVVAMFTCKGHIRSVDCVSINGVLVASGSFDKLLKIWSLEQEDDEGGIGNSKSGGGHGISKKKLKTGGNTKKVLTNKKTLTPLVTLTGHNEAITDVTWLRDPSSGNDLLAPEVLTCSMDNTIRLWDVEVEKVNSVLNGSKGFLGMSYSNVCKSLVTGSVDRHVRKWDLRSGRVEATFTSHEGWISCVAWSPNRDHLFISGSYDKCVKLWDDRLPKASLYDLVGHKDKVLTCDWKDSKYIVSGSADNHIKIFTK